MVESFIENGEERKGLKHLSWANDERFKEMELKIEGERRNNRVETSKEELKKQIKARK